MLRVDEVVGREGLGRMCCIMIVDSSLDDEWKMEEISALFSPWTR